MCVRIHLHEEPTFTVKMGDSSLKQVTYKGKTKLLMDGLESVSRTPYSPELTPKNVQTRVQRHVNFLKMAFKTFNQ
jgi:hypothetical protein